ncbi:hypothetical protein R1sor_023933 [Riccia sorocarpa]|uniref:Uncharacterized protein n=1 Tax=Riccia sorocarpa TaxID=122646 RepID=A0ABD3GS28_9MARC
MEIQIRILKGSTTQTVPKEEPAAVRRRASPSGSRAGRTPSGGKGQKRSNSSIPRSRTPTPPVGETPVKVLLEAKKEEYASVDSASTRDVIVNAYLKWKKIPD